MQVQWEAQDTVANYRAGLMPAVYINAHKKQSATPVTPLQLMGQTPRTRPSTAEEIMYQLTTMAMAKRGKQNG